jgi:hypothetical protein
MKDDESILVEQTYEIINPQLWTSVEPNLYQIDFVLKQCGEQHRHDNGMHDDKELDRVSVHHGIRKIHFDPNYGFFLNDQRYKIRGFCDHDTFAVVGMALPDRINLFRVSATRWEHFGRIVFGYWSHAPDLRCSLTPLWLSPGTSISQYWWKWSTYFTQSTGSYSIGHL